MTEETRRALALWWASRVAVVVATVAGAWTLTTQGPHDIAPFVSSWDHWDVGLFVKIARWGYESPPVHYPDHGVVAFFPGEPLVLHAVHLVVPSWIVAGLLISLVAGAVAMVALARIGAAEDGVATGDRAVRYLVLSPYAVFLFAGYSEALFLACALPAWLAARRERWVPAGVLAGLAAGVRITGLFLAVALLVEYAVARRRGGRRLLERRALALLLPFVVTAAYFGYLHHLTGDWLAWTHAQAQPPWSRTLTNPWDALVTTWHAAGAPGLAGPYAWSFRFEIGAVAAGLALTLVLAWLRRWGEVAYVGLQVLAFATSSFYLSVGRATLLWWPLWLLLARGTRSRPALHVAYLALAVPLMVVNVLTFTSGRWVG